MCSIEVSKQVHNWCVHYFLESERNYIDTLSVTCRRTVTCVCVSQRESIVKLALREVKINVNVTERQFTQDWTWLMASIAVLSSNPRDGCERVHSQLIHPTVKLNSLFRLLDESIVSQGRCLTSLNCFTRCVQMNDSLPQDTRNYTQYDKWVASEWNEWRPRHTSTVWCTRKRWRNRTGSIAIYSKYCWIWKLQMVIERIRCELVTEMMCQWFHMLSSDYWRFLTLSLQFELRKENSCYRRFLSQSSW